MKHVCVIPGRLGSKRLPRKNLRRLGDRPLIQHTIDSAIESGVFSKIIVSSESEEVLEKVRGENLTLDLRPPELASDTSKVIDTVKHCFLKYCLDEESIWLALPTCPLRTALHFQDIQYIIEEFPAVISVTNYEFPPTLALKMNKDGMVSSNDHSMPWETGNTRSQDHQELFRPNGAVYAARHHFFAKHQTFYTPKTYGYFMPRELSVDIDTKGDLDYAQFLLEKQL